MRNYFTFGGIDSRNYGIYLSGSGRFVIPERPYEFVSVPGRSGDVLWGGDRLNNVEIVYPCFLAPVDGTYGGKINFRSGLSTFLNVMFSVNGYADLRDSYDNSHIRKAAFLGGGAADMTQSLDAGSFDIIFNCKPQRYGSASSHKTVVSGSTVNITTNETLSRAELIITLTGTGTLTIGSDVITITQNPNGIIIDCERGVCYDANDSTVNMSQYVKLSNYRFPAVNRIGDPFLSTIPVTSSGLNGDVEVRWYEL